MNINESDKTLLLIILTLTVAPLTLLVLVAGFTAFNITAPYILMVIGWFFGAMMTWLWGKKQKN